MELPPLSRDQVRQVDQIAIQQYGMPGVVLMENAGRGAAEVIDRVADSGPIVILCGSGNNAGDGYVIARHLQLAGRSVRIVSIVPLDALQGDASINANVAAKAEIEITVAENSLRLHASLADAGTIIDGLLGTGARGPLRGLFAEAVATANASSALKISLDIPTGLDCDTGEAGDPTFRAEQGFGRHRLAFVFVYLSGMRCFHGENGFLFSGCKGRPARIV